VTATSTRPGCSPITWIVPTLIAACLTSNVPVAAADPHITAAVRIPGTGQILTAGPEGVNAPGFRTSQSVVHDLAFSPDQHRLTVAGGAPGESGQVELFAWPAGPQPDDPDASRPAEPLWTAQTHADVVYSVDWARDGHLLAVAGHDPVCVLLDAATGTVRSRLSGHSRGLTAVRFAGLESQTLITASLDGSIRVWGVASGRCERTLAQHTGPVTGLAVRPQTDGDGSPPFLVSISSDRTVRFWQPTIGRLVRFARLPVQPLAVVWSPDGRYAIVSGADGRVRLIDPDTAQIDRDLPGIPGRAWCLTVDPEGASVVVAGERGQSVRVLLDEPDSPATSARGPIPVASPAFRK